MAIEIAEVTDRGALEALEPEWRQLVADVPTAEVFSTPEWITSWLGAFWRDRPIRFLFAREGGRLVGVAPFLRDDGGRFCCAGALALPVDPVSWRAEILHAEDDGAVVEAMLAHVSARAPLRVNLSRVANDSTTARALRAVVKRKGLWGIWREDHRTPIISVPASLDEYLQSRSKHVRHELKRKQKRLAKAGGVTVRIVDRPEDLDAAFADVRAVEARSWKGEAETSFLEAPFAEAFYRSLFVKTAGEGWARIYIMHFKGKPVAHLFGLVFRRRYYALNSSFDESLGSYSPGAVLVLRGVEDACAQKYEVFDFMGTEYRWKNEMATEMREHLNVCVFSRFASRCGVNWIVDQQLKPQVRRHLPTVLALRRAYADRRGEGATRRPSRDQSGPEESVPSPPSAD